MLHVTNGGVAAEAIAAAEIGGDVLAWRDVLHEGPVPLGVTASELRTLRAHFLARCGWADQRAVLVELALRDQRLDRAIRGGEEIVLWFEHDLYDQLQLIQVLDRLAFDWASPRVSAVLPRGYLGTMSALEVVSHFAAAREVGTGMVELGRRAWRAFRAEDPRGIETLVAEESALLPDLGAALGRHLEQFPDTGSGLARSERQALEALADGPLPFGDLFRAAQRAEQALFLGDAVFELYLAELASEPKPLIERAGEAWLLTAFGRAVLAGEADRVAERGFDRWLGGVRLVAPRRIWRFDPSTRRLVAPTG
jgi:hypothetical protein